MSPYTADNVFPLKNVYSFAQRVGGPIASLISAIRCWSVPNDLVSYEATSQARRALCYLALQRHGLWEQFVAECWPTAEAASAKPIIEELERDFINNGLLARLQHTLPPGARDLRLPETLEERIKPPEAPSPNDVRRGEVASKGELQNPPPEPPLSDSVRSAAPATAPSPTTTSVIETGTRSEEREAQLRILELILKIVAGAVAIIGAIVTVILAVKK